MSVSAVDQAVITRGLIAAAHEMGAKLIRSAHSPIVREAQDCSAALMDPQGNVVAQAELIALQLGSISHTFRPCLELYPPETLTEDDFFINNDPYHGGQHIPDVFIFSPVFLDGALIGFSATVVHHIDMGGGAAGLNPDARDVHQEGIIFPPTKLSMSRDWNGGPLERFLRANVRMPEATAGDFDAQFAANAIGAERLRHLCRKFGPDTVREAMREVLDYSERRMRSALGAAPNGVYEGEDFIDDDGIGDTPIRIHATVTIEDDHVTVDLSRTDPQVATNINNPYASTVASAIACIKSVLTDADIPFNDGAARAITIVAKEGTIVKPRPPAPVRARLLPSYRVYNAVMKALAQAVPGRAVATGYDTTTSCCLSHLDDSGFNIYLEIFGGGLGAGVDHDGCDGVDCPLSNCANIPLESTELDYDFFRVEDYSLRKGSGGRGEHRGGLGFQKAYRILTDGVYFATYGDRFKEPSNGLFGGERGAFAETILVRDGEERPLAAKLRIELKAGDLLVMRTGGGGGYGAAEARSERLATLDAAEGFTA